MYKQTKLTNNRNKYKNFYGNEYDIMSKGLGYFFLVITFIMGVSVGLYTGFNSRDEKELVDNNRVSDIVQDVVIKKIQEESVEDSSGEKEKNIENEKVAIEVISEEEKISPYAKLIIKKTFSKCKHSTVNILDIPKELINLPKKAIEEKYKGWTIESFSSNEIILFREIDANCDDHFVIKEKDGAVAVYNELTEDKMNLIETLNVNVDLLGEEDKNNLKEGIKVYGKSELSSLIEDYNS